MKNLMFGLLSMGAVVGCASADVDAEWADFDEVVADTTSAPEGERDYRGGDLTLEPLVLVPGVLTPLTVLGGDHFERPAYIVSTGGIGPGPCVAPLGGACLDVASPATKLPGFGYVWATGEGIYWWSVPDVEGTELCIQAAIQRGVGGVDSLLSNVECAVVGGHTGMTWSLVEHDPVLGVDLVGCDGCNPYDGGTDCSESLAVLCLEDLGLPNPGIDTDFDHGWAGGNIALSAPVTGTALDSLATADGVCEAELGPGWRMGEFHDGDGGWNWWAYGDIASGTDRFWTYIDDQPANCWD